METYFSETNFSSSSFWLRHDNLAWKKIFFSSCSEFLLFVVSSFSASPCLSKQRRWTLCYRDDIRWKSVTTIGEKEEEDKKEETKRSIGHTQQWFALFLCCFCIFFMLTRFLKDFFEWMSEWILWRYKSRIFRRRMKDMEKVKIIEKFTKIIRKIFQEFLNELWSIFCRIYVHFLSELRFKFYLNFSKEKNLPVCNSKYSNQER